MRVTEGEPEIAVPRRLADDRQHIGGAGTRAHPWLGVEPFGEREQVARDRLGAAELDGRLDRIAQRELRARRETYTLPHRREKIAALRIEHGMIEPRLARCAVVHVVAAFYGEWQIVTERLSQHIGPRTERDYRGPGCERSLGRSHAPAVALRLQARGVALHEPAAETLEQPQINVREAARIVDADGIGPVQGSREHGRQMRLQVLQRAGV